MEDQALNRVANAEPGAGDPVAAHPLQLVPGSPLAARGEGDRAAARPRWWRDRLRRRMLACSDALAAAGIGLAVTAITGDPAAWALVAVGLGLLAAKLLGLYDADHRAIRHQTLDELQTLAGWVGIVAVATMLSAPNRAEPLELALVVLGGLALTTLGRATARLVWRRITPPERTLVVGAGAAAEAIRRKVELFDDMHLELVDDLVPGAIAQANGADPLDAVIADVDRVVIAWAEADPALVERLVELCRRHQAKLSVISPFRGRARPAARLSQVADLPILEYNTWDVPRSTRVLKRAFDVTASAILLILLAPVFALIAIAIKLSDGGPVFFRQTRAGLRGEPFRMLKFRTMVVDAESRLADLVSVQHLADPMFKLRGDPRVTRVGRFLRRYSLDELPQLWNVLRGEMSIVGPRPEETRVVERYRPEHRFRLELPPGLTGPMQVFGRGELTFSERLAVELDYIENLSIGRDIGLIARTAAAVVRGKGAF